MFSVRLQPIRRDRPDLLHAADCARYEADTLPAWFAHLTPALVRSYDAKDWIV